MNVKQNSIIVSLCVLELDEVTVGHIRETFGNLILSLLNQPNWYVHLIIFYYVVIYLVLSFRKRGSNSGLIFSLILRFYTIYQINH